MSSTALEEKLENLVASISEDTFIYELLRAYEQPKASITRLKRGDYNLSKIPGEVLWKRKLCFKSEPTGDLYGCIDTLKNDKEVKKHHPRFVIVTDYRTLLAVDNKTGDTLDTALADLPQHYDFFLPWMGMEKSQMQSENPADIKAAERMGRLYELILHDNPAETDADRHALNIFLSRLLFCFFAEDTDIFNNDQFTNAVASHTAEDGSDLQAYLQRLFTVLSIEDRTEYPSFLREFPYVNGGLFSESYPVPKFSTKSRGIILECGQLNWKAINPDIFGSMMQAVMHNEHRSSLGMHYTSVVNIMKVIEPLFLNDLNAELENAGDNRKKLTQLLERLYALRIFDPACGSGNFLIIAYKELCKLEIETFKRLHGEQRTFRFESGISLTQFFGIEIDDFAHETAKLSLWLAEHQMNLAFKEVFGASRATLPLQDGGVIVCRNSTRVEWEEVCPDSENGETFLLGNPPYLGARNQNTQQKSDVKFAIGHLLGYNNLDYISCWFVKSAEFLKRTHAKAFAFVSTNSISQGTQVPLLWPSVLNDLEIGFAHRSFKWTNNAKGNAGVTCVIVGVRKLSSKPKYLYTGSSCGEEKNISPYIFGGKTVYVHKRRSPLCDVPNLRFGSMANDGGNLVLTPTEAKELLDNHADADRIVRKFAGSKEFINGIERYCLWIGEQDLEYAESISTIAKRIDLVRNHRLESKRPATQALADKPHRFAETRHVDGSSLIIPKVSSERRRYIPIGFLDTNTIISDLAFAVYNPTPDLFAQLSSRMHMIWVLAVGGRLKTDPRYSAGICYNTFPFPDVGKTQRVQLEECAFRVLDERESHSERNMAQLYDPDDMPTDLRDVHRDMDVAVEKCYRNKPFEDDEERLRFLFEMYERKIIAQTNQETINA